MNKRAQKKKKKLRRTKGVFAGKKIWHLYGFSGEKRSENNPRFLALEFSFEKNVVSFFILCKGIHTKNSAYLPLVLKHIVLFFKLFGQHGQTF
jgi:hypothetical protein